MRIEPTHYWTAGIEIRPNICTAVGDRIDWHSHTFSHMTMVTRGKWLMRLKDGTERVLASAALGQGLFNEWYEVPGDTEHYFEVLELEGNVAALTCLWAGGIK